MADNLMNVDVALAHILAEVAPLAGETVPLTDAFGRVLAADIVSALDLPPFANSAVDGYAVRAHDVQRAGQIFAVSMDIRAGTVPQRPLPPREAARIMTGAPLPEGADAVVMMEDTDTAFAPDQPTAAQVTVLKPVTSGANVRPVGENIRQGQTVLPAARVLRPADIGLLASIGAHTVTVRRRPRVALLSSGDELVDIDQPLRPGTIHDSNSYALEAAVRQLGGIPLRLPPAADTLPAVRALFQAALDVQPDLIVSTAGVSVGAADLVRTVLEAMGEINFWRINLRPGKPLAFGHLGGVPFFGLPGNPVSALVTFEVMVRPVLMTLQGRADHVQTVTATSAETVPSDGRRTFVRVRLEKDAHGAWLAHTTGTQSSGALYSLVLADGLMIIPEDVTVIPAGSLVQVRLL